VSRKQPHERVRPQIGDVIEIPTPRELAYAQYTQEHREPPRHGSLLRVLPGLYGRRPDDLRTLVEQERFSCLAARDRRQTLEELLAIMAAAAPNAAAAANAPRTLTSCTSRPPENAEMLNAT
jgi:hypothetical protein